MSEIEKTKSDRDRDWTTSERPVDFETERNGDGDLGTNGPLLGREDRGWGRIRGKGKPAGGGEPWPPFPEPPSIEPPNGWK